MIPKALRGVRSSDRAQVRKTGFINQTKPIVTNSQAISGQLQVKTNRRLATAAQASSADSTLPTFVHCHPRPVKLWVIFQGLTCPHEHFCLFWKGFSCLNPTHQLHCIHTHTWHWEEGYKRLLLALPPKSCRCHRRVPASAPSAQREKENSAEGVNIG